MSTTELASLSRARIAEGQLAKVRAANADQATQLRNSRLELCQTQRELAHTRRFVPVDRHEEMRRTAPNWRR